MPKLQTTGYNAATAKHLLLDAGAVYKNFDETLFKGELIGATQGGNSITIVPNMRTIEVDGVKSEHVKGLTVIDSIEASLTTNLLEVTKDTITMSLGVVEIAEHDENYDSIRGKYYISDNDYIDNIAYVGKLSGSDKPVIVILYNALNLQGLQLDMADKAEGKLPITFHAHVGADDLENPPYKILYPKGIENTATVDPSTFSKALPVDSKFTVISTGNADPIGVKLGLYSLKTSEYTAVGNVITIKKEYLATLEVGDHVFTLRMDKGNNITAPKIKVTA